MTVVLSKGEGNPSQLATLELTITLSSNPTITADNPITNEADNQPAEGVTAPSVAHTVESSLAVAGSTPKSLSPSAGSLPIESGTPAPPTAAEMSSAKKALHDANDAMKTINLYDTWDKAVGRINWVMNTVGPVAEVYTLPFFAYPLLSQLPLCSFIRMQRWHGAYSQ